MMCEINNILWNLATIKAMYVQLFIISKSFINNTNNNTKKINSLLKIMTNKITGLMFVSTKLFKNIIYSLF